jgi:predicted peroxiredoxin
MPGQLAKKVRAKFPGQYDDLDDATLESKILAKYPDYGDLANEEKKPESDLSRLITGNPPPRGAVGQTWDALNTAPKFITNRTRVDPNDTIVNKAGGMWESMKQVPGAIRDIASNAWERPSSINAMGTGFARGATEGLGELASPVNIADAATGFGKGGLVRGINRGVSALTAAGGVSDIADGNLTAGIPEVIFGALGARSRGPKVNVVPEVKPPIAPVVKPQLQLPEFAGMDPRTIEGQAAIIARRGPAQKLLPAYTPPPEVPSVERFISHPSGKVAHAFDVDAPEALQGLDLQRPGTTNPVRQRGVELPPVVPPKAWDFDSLGTRSVEEPYNLPRSQGVQSVSSKSKGRFKDAETAAKTQPGDLVAKGEVTGRPAGEGPTKVVKVKYRDELGRRKTRTIRVPEDASPEVIQMIKDKKIKAGNATGDYLDSDPLMGTVPNSLRPEAPNVTRLRDMSQGYGKQGAPAPKVNLEVIDEAEWQNRNWGKEGKTVDLGGGVTGRIKNPKLNYQADTMLPSAPVKGSIDRFKARPITEAPPVEPIKASSFESGKGSIDRNKLDVISPSGKPIKSIVKDADVYSKGNKKKEWLDEKLAKVDEAKKAEPSIKNALKMARTAIRNSAPYKSLYEKVGVSGETQLNRLGKGGKDLAKVMGDEATSSNTLAGQHRVKVREARRILSKEEQSEVVEMLDGTKPVSTASSDNVKTAYQTFRKSLDDLAEQAKAAGVKMKNSAGDVMDFQKHAGEYFPRYYDPKIFKNPLLLEERLLKAGNSPVKVKAMLDNIREKGEMFSPGQHTRDFNLPEGYDKSLEALEKYYVDMSQSIRRAKKYGGLDTADDNSLISQMIRKTDNKTKAKNVVEQHLGRVEGGTESDHIVTNAAQKWTAGTKLSLQAITNLTDIAGSASTLGVRNTAKAIAKTLKNPHISADFASKVGALNIDKAGLLRETGKMGKWTGANATEKFVRTVEALAGQDEVQKVFKQAKANPKYARKLERFVEGDVNQVLKQDKLTPEQIEFASGRAAELVSGVPSRLALSEGFYSKNPVLRLPLLLKRFAFLNTKNMVKAVRAEPTALGKAKKAATILAAYGVAGELTGDAKAAIKGLVTGDIEKSIEERGEDQVGTGNAGFDRIMANWMQANMFQLPGDIATSLYKKGSGKVTGTLGGPILSDADELLGISSAKDVGKSVAKRIPIIGAGLAEKFFPSDKKGNKFSQSLSR